MTTTSVAILVPTGANQLEVAAVITKIKYCISSFF